MRSRRTLVTIACAVVALAGCRDSEGEMVRKTVDDFTSALARGDGQAACDKLAEAGVSELLLTAVKANVNGGGLEAPETDRCAVIARRLAAGADGLAGLRGARVTRTLLEGDTATVDTDAGAYELEEVKGRWRLTRFEPVAAVLAGKPAPERPVALAIARPKLPEPALGRALAGSTRKEDMAITGTYEPANARLRIEPSAGTRVKSFTARDGRLRAELQLQRGRNQVVLSASAPGHEDSELAVRLTRE